MDPSAFERAPSNVVTRESVSPGTLSDTAAAIDQLGFSPYVDAVSAFLSNTETRPPLTISIEGAWGSGKTSFMKQLRAKLPVSSVIIEFNPWRHDKDESLWSAFALEFLRKVRRAVPWWRSLVGDVVLFWKRLRLRDAWMDLVSIAVAYGIFALLLLGLIRALITGEVNKDLLASAIEGAKHFAGWVSIAAAVGALLVRARKIVGNPLGIDLRKHLDVPDYAQRVAFIEQVHSDFRSVLETYVGKRKVFVFIDDLDRCDPIRAADLMQAINLLIADDPRLIFVIGMDRAKVAAGLAVKFEKVIDYLQPVGEPNDENKVQRGVAFGRCFIEKFIQLPFLVPRPSATDLRKLFAPPDDPREVTPELSAAADRRQKLELELSKDSNAVRDLIRMVAEPFDANPRRVKQFMNVFRLRAYIASETGLFSEAADVREGERALTLIQLGKLVAISLQWPLVLEEAADSPRFLPALERIMLDRPTPSDATAIPSYAREWLGDLSLKMLLGFGMEKVRPAEAEGASLANVNLGRILGVLPPMPRQEATTSGVAADRSRVSKIELPFPDRSYTGTESTKSSRASKKPQRPLRTSPRK
jgi:hypothetical protein